VSLQTEAGAVTAVTDDFHFDANQFTLGSCVPSPGLDKQVSQQSLAEGHERIALGPCASGAIADGQLYVCPIGIGAEVAAGSYPLMSTFTAVDPSCAALPGVVTTPGQITVTTCRGDCNGSGAVSIGEVIRCINEFLGQPLCHPTNPLLSCPVADANGSGTVSIGEVALCVGGFLNGCE